MAIALPMPLDAPVTNTDFPANSIYHFKFMATTFLARCKAAPRLVVQSAESEYRVRSLDFDHLDPIRALSHWIARRLTEPAARLIDPVDREPIRFLARGNEVMPAGIDIDAARLALGGKIGDVSELAGARRHSEQRDLIGVALGRVKEFPVWHEAQIGGPDWRLLVRLGRCRGGRRRSADRRLRLTPFHSKFGRHRRHRVDEFQGAFTTVDRILRDVTGQFVEHVKKFIVAEIARWRGPCPGSGFTAGGSSAVSLPVLPSKANC